MKLGVTEYTVQFERSGKDDLHITCLINYRNENQKPLDYLFGSNRQIGVGFRRLLS